MMKHSHFSSLFINFYSRFSLRNAPGHVSLYSTAAAKSHRKSWQVSLNLLYRRISRTGYPRASAFSILDQWIQEGRTVDKDGLVSIIKELRHFKDYSQALEVSMWMTDKRYIELLPSDTAIRLDLIAKVRGIEQAENYFNNIPKQLKVLPVYSALLNCYAHAKQLEKAEATMQKMRDLGFTRTPLVYNVLLNLYYQTGNREKFDTLMIDMEENGIGCDRYTYGIRLSAAAAASDLEGVNKIMAKCESDPKGLLDWTNYAVAANGYAKAGDVDKALAMLKKSEQLIPCSKRQRGAYEYLMTQYAVLGKKDNTLRLWKHYKEQMKVYNRGYICIITSLVKIGDIESAEKIFEEWDSAKLHYDIRIPNSFIGAYTRKGLLDKAEAIINRIISKGEKPSPTAWNYLARGYLDHDQIEKAVESTTESSFGCTAWVEARQGCCGCMSGILQNESRSGRIRRIHKTTRR
ncbi:hypothetical protein M0R45_030069 [Rubus argutus]|uniref:Pentatricopeptide repeat-containing protein n=1 Tax=Rubus argutus TaxID=59490 RepID=A0AAW1W9W9_RUBAR